MVHCLNKKFQNSYDQCSDILKFKYIAIQDIKYFIFQQQEAMSML